MNVGGRSNIQLNTYYLGLLKNDSVDLTNSSFRIEKDSLTRYPVKSYEATHIKIQSNSEPSPFILFLFFFFFLSLLKILQSKVTLVIFEFGQKLTI